MKLSKIDWPKTQYMNFKRCLKVNKSQFYFGFSLNMYQTDDLLPDWISNNGLVVNVSGKWFRVFSCSLDSVRIGFLAFNRVTMSSDISTH